MNESSDVKRNEALLSARQVIDRWPDAGLSRAQLWRWARDGLIASVRLPSGRVRFPESEIERMLAPQAAPSVGSAASTVDVPPGQAMLSWPGAPTPPTPASSVGGEGS
ncbi:helix-turn-helix domain-containing protein [Actinomyces marmotae]|uniref:Helix-turn-helix domain-containing protein n=1 Tax=Actinomyces marmotae TaxID=2737173 RepID=A0A6M8AZR8_9ACTO|nr:helix-turn-helix domain-containing protein [Actinomyces marmotae]